MGYPVLWALLLFCAIAAGALAMGLPSVAAGAGLAALCLTSLIAAALGAVVVRAGLNRRQPDPFVDPD